MRRKWFAWIGGVSVIALIGCAAYLAQGRALSSPEREATALPARQIPVALAPASRKLLERRLTVQGNVLARHYASVPARVAGTIEDIFVAEGDAVKAGETKLFQIDALKLNKALEIARQSLAVARCVQAERQAALERAEVEQRKAAQDRARFERLFSGGAVAENEWERVQMVADQSQAALKLARASLDLAAEQVRQAHASVTMAEKDARDALVLAPISGRVCKRLMEKGELAQPGQAVLRVEDTDALEVSIFLPAALYPQVIVGRTPMRVRTHGKDLGEHLVSYRSPTVDPSLRTFEAKCRLSGANGLVVPGSMAEVDIVLEQRTALAVPATAVLERNGRQVVFVADGDTARQVAVRTGLEQDGTAEVLEGALKEGERIVVQGQFLLNDGTPLRVQEN